MFVRFVCCLACGLSLTSNIYYIEHPCVARVTAPWSIPGHSLDMVPNGESMRMLYLLVLYLCLSNAFLDKHVQLQHNARQCVLPDAQVPGGPQHQEHDKHVAAAHSHRLRREFGAAAARDHRVHAGERAVAAAARAERQLSSINDYSTPAQRISTFNGFADTSILRSTRSCSQFLLYFERWPVSCTSLSAVQQFIAGACKTLLTSKALQVISDLILTCSLLSSARNLSFSSQGFQNRLNRQNSWITRVTRWLPPPCWQSGWIELDSD